MIRERVNAGLARASAKGTKLGRRPAKPAIETRIRELKAQGIRDLTCNPLRCRVGCDVDPDESSRTMTKAIGFDLLYAKDFQEAFRIQVEHFQSQMKVVAEDASKFGTQIASSRL